MCPTGGRKGFELGLGVLHHLAVFVVDIEPQLFISVEGFQKGFDPKELVRLDSVVCSERKGDIVPFVGFVNFLLEGVIDGRPLNHIKYGDFTPYPFNNLILPIEHLRRGGLGGKHPEHMVFVFPSANKGGGFVVILFASLVGWISVGYQELVFSERPKLLIMELVKYFALADRVVKILPLLCSIADF